MQTIGIVCVVGKFIPLIEVYYSSRTKCIFHFYSQRYNYHLMALTFPTALLITLLIASTSAIANPGVLISIPFPLSPPTLTLHLPIAIPDILLSSLELNNILLREVDYSWQLFASKAEVNITRAVISFDWYYKHDSGKGFFFEDELQLDFEWKFIANRDNRLQIDITYTKIKPGTMKVELGGKVIETVAVEVTNLIINKASVIFRNFIANKLSSALTDASKIIGQDLQIYHDSTHNKNIKINTTLVAAPLINNQTLFLQMNAAPYIQGESSGVLNPSDVLVKANSTKIQLQAHKSIASKILELALKIRGGVALEIKTSAITTVINIDSLALSPVFPPMGAFPENRDVVFSISIPTVTFDLTGQSFSIKFRGQCGVSTQSHQSRTLYMNPINASGAVELTPIFGASRSSIRITKSQITGFSPDREDIDGGLIIPSMLSQYFPELMDWITQAVNFQLNRKVLQPAYQNIRVVLKGKALNDHAYNLEIELN